MNTLAKLDRTSRLLVLISLMGILSSLSGFWFLARQGSSSRSGHEIIASISVYSNDTRVKRSSDIHWNQVTENLDFYDQDRVFTGPHSSATVQFQDGGEIKLFPNSLVFITKNMVELESGTIEVDISNGAPLKVKSFGEKFTAEKNTKIRVIKDHSAKKIIPLNDSARKLPIVGLVNKEPEPVTQPILKTPTVLPAPKVKDTVQSTEADSIALKWEGPADAEYELEVAEGDKSNVIESLKIKGQKHTFAIPRPSHYYWRIKYKQDDSESTYSEYSTFEALDKIEQIKTPLMKYPSKDAIVKSPDPKVQFAWEQPGPGLEYLLEIFSSADGKPIANYNVKGGKKTHIFDKKSAKYWWRARAISRHGNLSSSTEKLQLSVSVPPAPKVMPASQAKNMEGDDYIQLKGREDIRGVEW